MAAADNGGGEKMSRKHILSEQDGAGAWADAGTFHLHYHTLTLPSLPSSPGSVRSSQPAPSPSEKHPPPL